MRHRRVLEVAAAASVAAEGWTVGPAVTVVTVAKKVAVREVAAEKDMAVTTVVVKLAMEQAAATSATAGRKAAARSLRT
jgi:hypothetical protein